MRSIRGVLGASVLLLALPVTIVFQLIFDAGAETVIHVCLALGAFLVAAAAFDFHTPPRLTWLGVASTAALGVAFSLQALSELVPNDWLYLLAYTILGPLEALFLVGLLVWVLGLSLVESSRARRIAAWATLLAATCATILTIALLISGGWTAVPQGLRLVYLLPIGWLLWTSLQRQQQEFAAPRVSPEPRPRSA
jgi:hypothetical protein